jgi:hypothetical protein
MTVQRNPLYVALCKESTRELYSRANIRRHGIRGPSPVDRAVRTLVDLGEFETGNEGPTDPLFAPTLRRADRQVLVEQEPSSVSLARDSVRLCDPRKPFVARP